jgi:hypothetical protein
MPTNPDALLLDALRDLRTHAGYQALTERWARALNDIARRSLRTETWEESLRLQGQSQAYIGAIDGLEALISEVEEAVRK